MVSWTMPTFSSFSGTATMALGVTSEPVPAVVGMRIMGTHFLARPGSSSSYLTPYSSVTSTLASLAASMTLPPTQATIMSAPLTLNSSTTFCTAM